MSDETDYGAQAIAFRTYGRHARNFGIAIGYAAGWASALVAIMVMR